MGGWVGGWVGRWVSGWMGGQVVSWMDVSDFSGLKLLVFF